MRNAEGAAMKRLVGSADIKPSPREFICVEENDIKMSFDAALFLTLQQLCIRRSCTEQPRREAIRPGDSPVVPRCFLIPHVFPPAARTGGVMQEFGDLYRQQYAVALFYSVRFEIEGGGGRQAQLLHRKASRCRRAGGPLLLLLLIGSLHCVLHYSHRPCFP